MARPRPALPEAAELRACIDAEGRLAVRVTPGAREQSITITGGKVQVKVRAVPDKGAANAAVEALLAKALGTAPTRITLLRGGASRQKLFRVACD